MLAYLTLILCCQLAGELLVAATDLPVPGPVCGMVLLFTGLMVRRRLPDELATVAGTLLRHLSLLFVPAGVGLILHLSVIAREYVAISAALVASTVLTIAVTAGAMVAINRWRGQSPP